MLHIEDPIMESKENKRVRYSYEKDGKSYSITCKQISNGYVVCIYKSWEEKSGDKTDYKSEETETYYKEDPFAEKENKKEESKETDVMSAVKSFMGKLNPLINS